MRISLALAVLLIAACSRQRSAEPEPAPVPAAALDTVPAAVTAATSADSSTVVRDYRGTYSSGYEISWFEPCNAPRGERLWWVTLSEDARLQRDSLVKLLPARPTRGLAVHWRATVSPRMRGGTGHMGQGSRYMLVTRILSVRAIGDGVVACGGRDV